MSHLSTIIQRVRKQADLQNEENLKKNVENIRDYIEAWNNYSEEELIEAYSLYHKYGPRLQDFEELPLDNTNYVKIIPKEEVEVADIDMHQGFSSIRSVQKSVVMEVEDDE